ncbi:hypothetical protein S83_067983 [Arachis hypogaea]
MNSGQTIGVLLKFVKHISAYSNDLYLVSYKMSVRVILFFLSIEIYKHPKEERIAQTWGTTAPGLPYVEQTITNAGNWLIGGDLEVIEPIKYNDGLDPVPF